MAAAALRDWAHVPAATASTTEAGAGDGLSD
jgi:hypothetical protein